MPHFEHLPAPGPATASPAAHLTYLLQLAEAARNSLGAELENRLEPVVAQCDTVCATAPPHSAEVEHAHQLREAIDALIRYETQTEKLLASYRYALGIAPPVEACPTTS